MAFRFPFRLFRLFLLVSGCPGCRPCEIGIRDCPGRVGLQAGSQARRGSRPGCGAQRGRGRQGFDDRPAGLQARPRGSIRSPGGLSCSSPPLKSLARTLKAWCSVLRGRQVEIYTPLPPALIMFMTPMHHQHLARIGGHRARAVKISGGTRDFLAVRAGAWRLLPVP